MGQSEVEAKRFIWQYLQLEPAEKRKTKAEWQGKAERAGRTMADYSDDQDSAIYQAAAKDAAKAATINAGLGSLPPKSRLKGGLQGSDQFKFALSRTGMTAEKVQAYFDELRRAYQKVDNVVPMEMLFAALAFVVTKHPKIAALMAAKAVTVDWFIKYGWPVIWPILQKYLQKKP